MSRKRWVVKRGPPAAKTRCWRGRALSGPRHRCGQLSRHKPFWTVRSARWKVSAGCRARCGLARWLMGQAQTVAMACTGETLQAAAQECELVVQRCTHECSAADDASNSVRRVPNSAGLAKL